MRSRNWWIGALAIHLFLIGAVSLFDIVNIAAKDRTVLPRSLATAAGRVSGWMQSVSPRRLAKSNPVRQIVVAYGHAAGVEIPYSFFAPNVSNSLNVVLEIPTKNDAMIYQVPRPQSPSEALRLAALIDSAGADQGLWREVALRMLASAAMEKYPEANRIRAIVTALKFPDPDAFVSGTQPYYDVIYTRDFEPDKDRRGFREE